MAFYVSRSCRLGRNVWEHVHYNVPCPFSQSCRNPTLAFGACSICSTLLHCISFAYSRSLQLYKGSGRGMTADLACSSLVVRRIRFLVQVPADMVESCDMTYPACANAVSTAVANTASLVLADTRFRNPMRTARASTSPRQPRPSTRPFTFLRIRFVRTKWKEWRVHERHGQLPVRLASMATWRILHGAHVRTCSSSTRRAPKEKATRTRSRAFRTMPRGKGRSRGSTWQGRGPRLWRW